MRGGHGMRVAVPAAPQACPFPAGPQAVPPHNAAPFQVAHARTWEGLEGGASPFPAPAVHALDGHIDRGGPNTRDADRFHKGDNLLVLGLRHDPSPGPPGVGLGLRQAHVHGALGHLNTAIGGSGLANPVQHTQGPEAGHPGTRAVDPPASPLPSGRPSPARRPRCCRPRPAPSPVGASIPPCGHAPSRRGSRTLPFHRAAGARDGADRLGNASP